MEKLTSQHLIRIFEFLDVKDLRSLLYVKEFKNAILDSPDLMRKLPVIFKGRATGHRQFLYKYADRVRHLDFRTVFLNTIGDIENVLKLTPNVESVKIDSQQLFDENTSPTTSLKLKHLKKLELHCDASLVILMLKLIADSDQLESIKIYINSLTSYFEYEGEDSVPEDLIVYTSDCAKIMQKFILNQKKLKFLNFSGNAAPLLFHGENIIPATFQLKEFVAKGGYKPMEISDHINCKKFLESQSNMEVLKITKIEFIDNKSKIFDTIFQKFQNLSVLEFNMKYLENDLNLVRKFANGDIELPSVRELYIAGGEKSCELTTYVLMGFVHTKILKVDYMQYMHFGVLNKFKELEKLNVGHWRPATLVEVKFSKLKSLVINNVTQNESFDTFQNICENNPQLESLECYAFDDLSDFEDLLKLMGTPNMKEFIFQAERSNRWLTVKVDFMARNLAISNDCEDRFPNFYRIVTEKWNDYSQTILLEPLNFIAPINILAVLEQAIDLDRFLINDDNQ